MIAGKTVQATKTKALVVSHTHWDREWYLPFQKFRIKLVDLIDSLINIFDTEPTYRYFMLDGQTIVLEDYLEVRPENREHLARYIREGRLFIGPWYVLPDEFLVSAESLVRNLLLGHAMAEPFGGVMPVGYLPDTFGHPAQMPQILRGFGLDSAVIYRGLAPERSEFLWEAPDGSTVLAVYLPGGYCNAMQLTAAPWRFIGRLPEIVGKVKAMATTDTLLLMNGCDHLPPRREIEEIIVEANQLFDGDVELEQGTLPQYIARVKAAMPELERWRGEFRLPAPARVTPGVVSARMYLKLENYRSLTLLEKYAEPIASVAWLLGEAYPHVFFWQAWKHLMQNHPHDSICGCSTDAVHMDMLARFRWTQEIAGELLRRGLDALAARVAPIGSDDSSCFLSFNPLARSHRDYVQQHLDFFETGRDFHVRNADGDVVPHQVLHRQSMTMFYDPFLRSIELDGKQKPSMVGEQRGKLRKLDEERLWRQYNGEEADILVLPGEIPACGYTTYAVCAGLAPEPKTDLIIGENELENSFLRVCVNHNGSLDVLDKATNTWYLGLDVLEDRGDRGDEYTYCSPKGDHIVRSSDFPAILTTVERGPIRGAIQIESVVKLPKGLSADRQRRSDELVGCPVLTKVMLAAGSCRVEIRTEVTNLAEDNILRVLFPSPIETRWSHALGQFEVVTRPVSLSEDELCRIPGPDEEVAVNTYPHHSFVDVNDGERGLAILSRGLTEYEAIPSSNGVTLALTLLRSVGWLSKGDLNTRFGHAGPGLPTPEAQCLGRYMFEYAILPHSGDWSASGVSDEAERYTAPAVCTQIRYDNDIHNSGILGASRTFLALEPAILMLSALKKAENNDALIVRFYNPTADIITARLRVDRHVREVRYVDLAERETMVPAIRPDRDGLAILEVRGFQICSLKLVI